MGEKGIWGSKEGFSFAQVSFFNRRIFKSLRRRVKLGVGVGHSNIGKSIVWILVKAIVEIKALIETLALDGWRNNVLKCNRRRGNKIDADIDCMFENKGMPIKWLNIFLIK